MLAVRCGISLEQLTNQRGLFWPVLNAIRNVSFTRDDFIAALSDDCKIHVFASTAAAKLFEHELSLAEPHIKTSLLKNHQIACGVGPATDQAARSLIESSAVGSWSVPEMANNGERLNGLAWTLSRLEALGLIPRTSLHLWTKKNSTSEKILDEFRNARQWRSWEVRTHEIYELSSNPDSLPEVIREKIATGEQVCFGVKSAEVLDATLERLMRSFNVKSPANLDHSIHFSVWEKGAQNRAWQLNLQARLVPWSEFEALQ
ncbi:MAG: hypothetical protein ACO3A4_02070 [Silvanigrellaceae bacterium]